MFVCQKGRYNLDVCLHNRGYNTTTVIRECKNAKVTITGVYLFFFLSDFLTTTSAFFGGIIEKEQVRFSETDITPPALSNKLQ